ncbi:glycoside hydrolase family 113 [Pedobacter arcticus]|uniref:glycoside hydrolase family 113 n=1 Tax=Pedobacter arcticus TaxID=752140 RepID=UPI0002FF7742|nr:hypothetical protein [Pedobacter arcticus]
MKSLFNLLFLNFLLFGLTCFTACNYSESSARNKRLPIKKIKIQASDKVNGVNFVAPPKAISNEWTNDLISVNCNWVALVPYAFTKAGSNKVTYDYGYQYWGESPAGIKENAKQAHQAGLKVMLKPHVWLQNGWIGDFNLQSEAEWKTWENDYRNYILLLTQIAIDEKIEMICLGTEYRTAVKNRPVFWKSLIKEVREIYKGKLTYCANWDDYEAVSFWEDLDFIGISAYFPLSDSKSPTVDELLKSWKPIRKSLSAFSAEKGKPILFTEYGYRSMDQAAWRSWEKENEQAPINNQAQAIAYDALYQTFWKEDWFAGGFAWKWYSSFRRMDSTKNHDWTPQNKAAELMMKKYYETTINR